MSKLDKKDQLFLADFLAENLNAEIPKQKEAKTTRFHKTAAKVKSVSDENNRRNNDTYGKMRSQGRLFYLTTEKISEYKDAESLHQDNHYENSLNTALDTKNMMEHQLLLLLERKEAIEEILEKKIPTKQSTEELQEELKKINLLLVN